MTEGFASVAPPLAFVAIGLCLSSGVRDGLAPVSAVWHEQCGCDGSWFRRTLQLVAVGTRMHRGCGYAKDENDENMKVYWSVPANDAIMRSTLNGSDLEPGAKTDFCQLQFQHATVGSSW